MSPRILVVEDDATVRSLLARFLRARGSTVVTLRNPGEMEFSSATVDVVITDLHFDTGNATGFDVIAQSRHLWPAARVVLLTGDASPEVVDRALALGAEAVVTKGQSLDELADLVFPRPSAAIGTTTSHSPT